MPDPGYVAAALAIGGGITFALRAVPFALLEPLRDSRFVMRLADWMPAGILVILALATLGAAASPDGRLLPAVAALAVTIASHLLSGRRTVISVTLGTLTYVGLLAVL